MKRTGWLGNMDAETSSYQKVGKLRNMVLGRMEMVSLTDSYETNEKVLARAGEIFSLADTIKEKTTYYVD